MFKAGGNVNDNLQAMIDLELLVAENFEILSCEIDTGFAGAIMIPRELVSKHQLPIDGQEYLKTVENVEFLAETTRLSVSWLGDEFKISAIVSKHGYALLGAEMFIDAVLTIDYARKTVTIEK